jgi:hypothetical protein
MKLPQLLLNPLRGQLYSKFHDSEFDIYFWMKKIEGHKDEILNNFTFGFAKNQSHIQKEINLCNFAFIISQN